MLPCLLLSASLALGQTLSPGAGSTSQPAVLPPGNPATSPRATGADTQPPSALPAGTAANAQSTSPSSKDQNGASNGTNSKCKEAETPVQGCFTKRLLAGYPILVQWFPECFGKKPEESSEDEPEKPRRALPAPFNSPPFPSGEYQGYPLVGVPYSDTAYPLMQAVYGGPWGDEIKDSRVKVYGWVNASGNFSTAKNSNTPDSYWIVPNHFELDQLLLRVEREVDSVQTDHIDVGFRSTLLYGIDYRYMTAGGWFSDQLLDHNRLYGADPTEQYIDVYFPGVAQGMIVRVGRWIACPDIETQFSPDNYLGTHSILFTFDTYTQTGVMATFMLNKNWMVQACIQAGTDMAPWYQGALPTGMFGVRWVSSDNNDSIYTCLNDINDAKFRTFMVDGQLTGHDNFNYIVSTWQHRFWKEFFTKTEGYFMWQRDAYVGGTPSLGPVQSFGGGGGLGAFIPGTTLTYGVVNYTEYQLSKKDFISFRNEWWRDVDGERSGFPGVYTSHTIGLTHNFNSVFQVRPEIGYYRNWTEPAFDLGTKQGIWIYGFDATLRF
ncbi:MAG TPA: outer membrane beta-barrel protein [Gemmataceae bacterium]|nr:outer membrane beta-barrel protein [Gemmataceae bacterium]